MRASQAFAVNADLTDVELASFPCAYSTGRKHAASSRVKTGEKILITGASGGVGSAALQLAVRRGAR